MVVMSRSAAGRHRIAECDPTGTLRKVPLLVVLVQFGTVSSTPHLHPNPPTCVASIALTPARAYSTGPSGQAPKPISLLGLAAGGAVVGFVGAMAGGFFTRPDGKAKLDGVPNVDVIETYGETWAPVQAIEKDDPKVCLDAIPAAASASANARLAHVSLGFGLMLRASSVPFVIVTHLNADNCRTPCAFAWLRG